MNEMVTKPERQSVWGVFNDLDDVFEGFCRPSRRGVDGGAVVPAVDVSENDDAYVVKAELPGVKKEDLNVTIHDGVLTINAEAGYDNGSGNAGRVIRQERRYGKYVRSLRIGDEIDREKIKAEYKDGLLSITLPKTDAVIPKKIEVQVA